jgi:hypothetical protein
MTTPIEAFDKWWRNLPDTKFQTATARGIAYEAWMECSALAAHDAQSKYVSGPITECEACLTPDACALRGQCAHYLREHEAQQQSIAYNTVYQCCQKHAGQPWTMWCLVAPVMTKTVCPVCDPPKEPTP